MGRVRRKYAVLFPGTTGNVAKPFRLTLGSLLLQNKLGCSDRELVKQLTENPYLQYFIGMLGYKAKVPINASILVLFWKRITMEMLEEVNEWRLERRQQGQMMIKKILRRGKEAE